MSDNESIAFDALMEAKADHEYYNHQANLLEQAVSTLIDLLPKVDVDEVLTRLKGQDAYGDPLHAVLMALADEVREEIARTSEQRNEALRKANKNKKLKAEDFWADRIEAATVKKRDNAGFSNSEIARQVIKDEIRDENITNEQDVDRLLNTVVATLRRKLGKIPTFKPIK
jgi:hypothetical protein